MKYALVKKWFYYTDDSTEADGTISPSVGVFESKNEANLAKRENDVESLRGYLNYLHEDLIRGFSYWYDRNDYSQQIVELKNLLSSDEFSSNVKLIGSDPKAYYFKSVAHLTDANLLSLIDLLDISFHEVLSYEEVKRKFYAVINVGKWNYDVIFEMMQNGLVVMGGYGFDDRNIEWASIVKSRSGNDLIVYFDTYDEAEYQTYNVLKEFIDVYPEYFEVLNLPVTKIVTNNLEIMKSFVKQSFSFELIQKQSDTYIQLSGKPIEAIELKSILDLVDGTYCKITEIETEINGIKTKAIGESLTF